VLHPDAAALIFDIDGTLVDTMPLHFHAWINASRKHGFPFDEQVFVSSAGMPAAKIIEMIVEANGLGLDPAIVAADKEAGFLELLPEARPFPDVLELVRSCHGRLPMALGTGGTRAVAWKTITASGLRGYFDILVAADDVVAHKPAPDTFLACATQMGVEPRRCQVFEDADKGVEAAVRAGMIPFDMRSCRPTPSYASLRDL